MRIVFTSYSSVPQYKDPEAWLNRIEGYTGILESLAEEHEVIGIERIQYEGSLRKNGVLYYFIDLKKKVVHVPLKLHRLTKGLQPDAVFINGLIFPLQIIQLKIQLGKKVKIIVLHRAEKPYRGLKKWIQRLADKFVDAYLFTSAEFCKDWQRNISAGKIHEVIQASSTFYSVDRTASRKILGIKERIVFLWVGSLIPRKDPITVVKAFLQYACNKPDVSLYMIYQSDELIEQVNDLLRQKQSCNGKIKLVGSIPHKELLHWYNSADFFITGSKYEGSGVAVAEAMSCGCIPITTDFISFKKMTGNGKCGLMFEAGNEKSLLSALMQTSKLNYESERASVIQQFQEELSFKAIAKKINRIIT
jgi:glycosyltransferase involved in cell wall biosynthesis